MIITMYFNHGHQGMTMRETEQGNEFASVRRLKRALHEPIKVEKPVADNSKGPKNFTLQAKVDDSMEERVYSLLHEFEITVANKQVAFREAVRNYKTAKDEAYEELALDTGIKVKELDKGTRLKLRKALEGNDFTFWKIQVEITLDSGRSVRTKTLTLLGDKLEKENRYLVNIVDTIVKEFNLVKVSRKNGTNVLPANRDYDFGRKNDDTSTDTPALNELEQEANASGEDHTESSNDTVSNQTEDDPAVE